jgi:hypothetical protein
MANLFGFSIEDQNQLPKSATSPVAPNNEDGVDYFVSSGFYGQYVDIEGVYRTEADLIKRYREMALHPECDQAIEDVVNEAIVSDLYDTPVQIDLTNLNASDGIKKIIRQEFDYIKSLMDFDKRCHEIFRNWYIDGRIYYHKVIDQKNPEAGILDIRFMDAIKVKYIRQIKKKGKVMSPLETQDIDSSSAGFPEVEEYFIYTQQERFPHTLQSASQQIKIARDAVTFCSSGLVDRNKGTVLSYLHKAIKALNQLRMIEDSLVIYRLSRAPERRIFYIDVGNLPKVKAEQYLRDVMQRYRNKLVYDANTGEIRDDRKYMSMMEDFWLPRREGGRGTEITTLPGGQNLGELTDVQYFQKKLYRSLNVPSSRIEGDGGFNLGRSSEILRDELKFSKFVGRLRKRFSGIFSDMLKTQLILKNVITPEDWELMHEHIQYDYLYDNHFSELKEAELLTERLNLAAQAEPYVGRYYSQDYVRRKILRQTDEDVIEQDQLIEKEIEEGIIPDPNQPIDPQTGLPIEPGSASMDLGQPVMEPDLGQQERSAEVKMPKGGEI